MLLHWRELIFVSKWLLVEGSFWGRGGGLCPWDTIWYRPSRPDAHGCSLCEFTWAFMLLCLEYLVSLMFTTPWLLQFFCFYFHRVTSAMRGGIGSHLALSVSRSLTLRLAVGLCVPVYCRRKFLWWRLSKAPIYERSRKSLGVISWLCSCTEQYYVLFP